MQTLVDIAEGLLYCEGLADNMRNIDSIISYSALNGAPISVAKAKKIQRCLKEYLVHRDEGTSLNWHTYVVEPLSK